MDTTFKWSRGLYEMYREHYGDDSPYPVAIDADDFIHHPEILKEYAPLASLDPDKLRTEWEPASQAAIDIEAKAVKWRAEFGEKRAMQLEGRIRDAMPDYLYMKARRLMTDATAHCWLAQKLAPLAIPKVEH